MGRFTDAIKQTLQDIGSLLKEGRLAEEPAADARFTPQQHGAYQDQKDSMARRMNAIEDEHGIPRGTSDPQWLTAQLQESARGEATNIRAGMDAPPTAPKEAEAPQRRR